MKKLILIFLLAAVAAACGTVRPTYFNRVTQTPQHVVDSLSRAYELGNLGAYDKWPRTVYLSDDSVQVMDYTAVVNNRDTLYIISVTEDAANGTEVLFRKEVRK